MDYRKANEFPRTSSSPVHGSPVAKSSIRFHARALLLLVVIIGAFAAQSAHAAGRWCISNDVLLFGNRAVGSNSTATAVVSNCGDAAWSFTDVSVHSATGPAFHITSTCSTGLSLAPGASCSVTVLFAPLTAGQTSGGVWLHNTTNTPDQLLTFYGRGVDSQQGTATLSFVPTAAVFPSQTIGKQSDAIIVELHNLGAVALTPSNLVLNGPEVYDFIGYPLTCRVGVPIAAGQSCTVALYFTPQQAGTRLANLVVDSPQLTSLAIMQISGVGAVATPAIATAGGPANIPTLGWEALVLLIAAMGVIGFVAARARSG